MFADLRHLTDGALATAWRVLKQLRRDPSSLILLLFVPCALLALLDWAFSGTPGSFERIGPRLFGVFPLMVMFSVSSIATLRERLSGTLERLSVLPASRFELVAGYLIAFGSLAVIQVAITTVLATWALGMDVHGPMWLLAVSAMLSALTGAATGLLTSSFARTEFQAVQQLPTLILPQFLLCGLFVAPDAMPTALRLIANSLPMTYAVDATERLATTGPAVAPHTLHSLLLLSLFLIALLAAAAATLRRHRT